MEPRFTQIKVLVSPLSAVIPLADKGVCSFCADGSNNSNRSS